MNRLISTGDDVYRLVNHRLTRKLILLHNAGYDLDFILLSNHRLLCVQDEQCYSESILTIKTVDQVHDCITNSFKYLHTVETACGKKGILLIEGIYDFQLRKTPISFSFPWIDSKQPN